MHLGDRSSTILLTVITLVLALAVGLVIPLASGSTPGGKPEPWTPPPTATPTTPPPTATSRPPIVAKAVATATRVPPTATSTASALPTVTSSPTMRATATLTAAASPTRAPIIAPTATLTASIAAPLAQVREGPVNLRAGPNQDQFVLGTAAIGQTFTITARTADNAWLQVCCVNNQPAWLSAPFVAVTGTIAALPIKP